MNKVWRDKAWDEYVAWQKQDKRKLKRINDLLKDIDRQPFTGIGKPGPLKGDKQGYCMKERVPCGTENQEGDRLDIGCFSVAVSHFRLPAGQYALFTL